MTSRLLKALNREAVDRPPVWLMRQAGRYLPEYREIRARVSDVLALCKTPELACQATLQPLARYPLDAAIIFSDILTVPHAMGLDLHFAENEGPIFHRPIRQSRDIAALPIPDPELSLGYVMDAIRMVRSELKDRLPLIGFCGSPWTIATYMIEGKGSRDFQISKTLMYNFPKDMHLLLDKLTEALISYCNAQIHAGVDVIMIFDTWGGVLSEASYREFSLIPMKNILSRLETAYRGKRIPVIFFTKGNGAWLQEIAKSGCDAVGLDWAVNMGRARALVGGAVALQGNLDPLVLLSTPEVIRKKTEKMLEDYGPYPGYIVNVGHGVLPTTPPENVAVMIETVHRYQYR